VGKDANQLLGKDATAARLQEARSLVTLEGNWYGELQQVTKDGKESSSKAVGRWCATIGRNHINPNCQYRYHTEELLESQFLRAQRMESIGTLAGGIAHDLNNVLAPILMAVQLLALKLEDERSQQWLNILEVNAKRGADLVKQVVSFARGIDGDAHDCTSQTLNFRSPADARETFPKSMKFTPMYRKIVGS
jgi:signal transduction histidine kinase